MQIETERLILRPFRKIDLDDLAALNGDEETMKFISPPLSRKQVEDVIDWFISEWQRCGFGWFAIFEKVTGQFIGQSGLQHLEGNPESADVELAFVISKSVRGRGYAVEAAKATVNYGFTSTGLNKIVAVTMKENLPSHRVLAKTGFKSIDYRFLYGREVTYYEIHNMTNKVD